MENCPPFDLNAALRRWRDALQNRQGLRPEDVAELESHARDAIEDLRRKGLTEEEALLVALRRLGPAERLQTEFGKVDPRALWLPRLLWMAFGVTAYLVAKDLTSVAACAAGLVGGQFVVHGFTLGWLAVGARVLATAIVIGLAGLLIKFRSEPVEAWASRCLRHPVAAVGVFAVAVLGMGALATGGVALLVRSLPPTAVGQFYVVNAWGAMVAFVVAPLAMIAPLMALASSRPASKRSAAVLGLLAAVGIGSLTGCGDSSGSRTAGGEAAQPGQTPMEQVFSACAAGKQDEAAEAFLKLDFNQTPLFMKGSALSYSETEFVALPQAARGKLAKQAIADLGTLKALCRRVADLAKEARANGDTARADKCAQQLQQCGDRLNNPSSLLIAQLTGKALQKLAAEASASGTSR
jgi:hypothetical protein